MSKRIKMVSLSESLELFPSLEEMGMDEHTVLDFLKKGVFYGYYNIHTNGWRVSVDSIIWFLHRKAEEAEKAMDQVADSEGRKNHAE